MDINGWMLSAKLALIFDYINRRFTERLLKDRQFLYSNVWILDSSSSHHVSFIFFFLSSFFQDKNDTEPSTTYRVETESCVCIAPRNYAKGEQINIFYGERSNADFLVHNGFVYPENHHDVLKIKFGISNSDSYMLRLALLRKLKLPPSGEYLIKADKEQPIHSSVLAFVRIFKMNEGKMCSFSLLFGNLHHYCDTSSQLPLY